MTLRKNRSSNQSTVFCFPHSTWPCNDFRDMAVGVPSPMVKPQQEVPMPVCIVISRP